MAPWLFWTPLGWVLVRPKNNTVSSKTAMPFKQLWTNILHRETDQNIKSTCDKSVVNKVEQTKRRPNRQKNKTRSDRPKPSSGPKDGMSLDVFRRNSLSNESCSCYASGSSFDTSCSSSHSYEWINEADINVDVGSAPLVRLGRALNHSSPAIDRHRPASAPPNSDTFRELDGHVFRPGRESYTLESDASPSTRPLLNQPGSAASSNILSSGDSQTVVVAAEGSRQILFRRSGLPYERQPGSLISNHPSRVKKSSPCTRIYLIKDIMEV